MADPDGSGARVVASWPRTSHSTRFALGAGMDGTMYLATSGDRGGWHLATLTWLHRPAAGRRAAHDELIARTVAHGDGVVISDATYTNRESVTWVVARAGHAQLAWYQPIRGAGRDHDDDDGSFHDCF